MRASWRGGAVTAVEAKPRKRRRCTSAAAGLDGAGGGRGAAPAGEIDGRVKSSTPVRWCGHWVGGAAGRDWGRWGRRRRIVALYSFRFVVAEKKCRPAAILSKMYLFQCIFLLGEGHEIFGAVMWQ